MWRQPGHPSLSLIVIDLLASEFGLQHLKLQILQLNPHKKTSTPR